MKPLKKFLNPVSQWHQTKGFPDKPMLRNVLSFLRSQDFIEVSDKLNNYDSCFLALKDEAKKGNPVFAYRRNNSVSQVTPGKLIYEYWIRFCKPYDDKEEYHTVYFLRLTEDGSILSSDLGYIEYYDKYGSGIDSENDKVYDDYKEFVEQINSYFNW